MFAFVTGLLVGAFTVAFVPKVFEYVVYAGQKVLAFFNFTK